MAEPDRDDEAWCNADRVALWLATPDGRDTLRTALRRMGLPDAFDVDLEATTIRSAELMDRRGETIEVVAAWARQVLRWRATDLVRSPSTHRAPVSDDDDGPVAPDGHDAIELDLGVADLRRHVAAGWVGAPWQRSAALTYLTVVVDDGAVGEACPAPRAGADELARADWAGLYYAGIDDCFAAVGEDDSPALRQRRKRRVDQVRQLLAHAYAATQESADA